MKLAVLFCLASGLSFAGTWSGTLVDARCWGFEESNVGQKTTLAYVDRDRNLEVSLCAPGAKTKLFFVIPPDGVSVALDAAGNTQAADLIRSTGSKAPLRVVVNGEKQKNTIQVSSISPAK